MFSLTKKKIRNHVFHYPKEWIDKDWIFIGFEHEDFKTMVNGSMSGWKTKRLGLQPITVCKDKGTIKLVKEKYYPIFVSRKEYDEHQEMVKKLNKNQPIEIKVLNIKMRKLSLKRK